MSAERDRLAAALEEALDAAYHYSSYRWPQQQDCPRIAEALLSVVDRIASERAAAELEAAADAIPYSDSEVEAKQILRARADHLDPS